MAFGSSPFGTVPFGSSPAGATRGPDTSITVLIKIGTRDVSSMMEYDTWTAREILNQRDSMEFNLYVEDGWTPSLGERVTVDINGNRLWTGILNDFQGSYVFTSRIAMTRISVTCVDLTMLADRITANRVYEGMASHAIVQDLVTRYLAADGINAGGVLSGPTIQKAVFARKPVATCLDDICKLTGYHWTIDQYGTLHYFKKFSSTAPFVVTHANATFRSAQVRRTLDQYRNVQYAVGAHGVTDPVTDFHVGDGNRRTFDTAYSIAADVSVKVNGLNQTVGIRGVDDEGSHQWYWNKGEKGINQDSNGTLLTSNDQLSITYRGQYGPIATKIASHSGIGERQAVEGGTGLYEAVDQDSSLDGLDVAIAKARGDLRRYGTLDDNVDFETDVPGLAVGQTVQVTMNGLGLFASPMLITELETSFFAIDSRRYRVKATSGELKGTFTEFFQKVFSRGTAVTLTPDDVINEVPVAIDSATVTDLVAVTAGSAHSGVYNEDIYGMAEYG